MDNLRVAIVGVGSLAKALVEGVSYYAKNPDEKIGLMHPLIGNYRVNDLKFVAAFDVDRRKVGKKLQDAISLGKNVTREITSPTEHPAVVHRGPTLDGIHEKMRDSFISESNAPVENVVKILKDTNTQVVVNLVPSGSDVATRWYAEAALNAGCSYINCIPTPLVTDSKWRKRFEERDLVLLGDDTKSQMGATMLNRLLLEFLKLRGIRITKSEQKNQGGNADHYNLLHRSKTKESSKREALSKYLDEKDARPSVTFQYTGKPSGHKRVDLLIEGELFGKTPISIHSVIEDEISINGAGTIIDAIRVAQFLVDNSKQSNAKDVCPFLMKSSPKHMSDKEASAMFERIISSK
ncbi:inositol-3-phosphate synthase [Candidatus Micrarchaeota archaeon]|nr:inositol-3-phosphate synthase [Candidatus Micrarchaeota archaeon]